MTKLASPGDPYVDGMREIVPAERVSKHVSATVPIAKDLVPKMRRAISEFPADAQMQTVINVVLIYSLLGMSENEIAHVMNTTIDQVDQLKNTEAFQETYEMLHKEMISANSASLQSRIASYAADAVDNVMTLASDKVRDDPDGKPYFLTPPIVILKANQDILDRSGLAADALFGKDQGEDNTLNIVVHNDGDEKTDINVNVNFPKGRR